MNDAADRSLIPPTDAILAHFTSLMHQAAGWHAEDFLGLDVTMSQAKCLYVVSVRPRIGMSAVAQQLHIGLSSVSGLVDRLVEHGYLERHEDPTDRRQQLVSLTVAGGAVVERIRELNGALMLSLLRGLSSPELESLRVGIAALDREAQAIDPHPAPTTTPDHERTPA